MTRDFFDPTPEQQNVLLIDTSTLQKAQRMIAGCEACSEDAEIPFDNILDRLAGSDPSVTDYVLEVPARCLQCGAEIDEKTRLCRLLFGTDFKRLLVAANITASASTVPRKLYLTIRNSSLPEGTAKLTRSECRANLSTSSKSVNAYAELPPSSRPMHNSSRFTAVPS